MQALSKQAGEREPAALLIAQSGIVLSDWIYWPGGSAMFNEHLSH